LEEYGPLQTECLCIWI